MSLVGPRPERPEFVSRLERDVPFYGQRHLVKPGLTGWAQISYSYGASVDDARQKLQYHLVLPQAHVRRVRRVHPGRDTANGVAAIRTIGPPMTTTELAIAASFWACLAGVGVHLRGLSRSDMGARIGVWQSSAGADERQSPASEGVAADRRAQRRGPAGSAARQCSGARLPSRSPRNRPRLGWQVRIAPPQSRRGSQTRGFVSFTSPHAAGKPR